MCGSNDKTYPNECILKIAICKSQGKISKAHDGPCSKLNNCDNCIYNYGSYTVPGADLAGGKNYMLVKS